jgi:hypothetical protein
MSWTEYRQNKNDFKLHFSFELNRMIPTEFWRGTGNSCEKYVLKNDSKWNNLYC